jgi:hypothetical protein
MTFSLVARSADGATWGVAVASKFLAAGAVVPAARAGQGAVGTQSFVNLQYLPDGHDGEGALDDRLFDWLGWENYEERHVPGAIDPVVLAKLREAVAAA